MPVFPDISAERQAGITKRRILDRAGQGSGEVRGAGSLAVIGQHTKSRACVSTLMMLMYSWQWDRKSVACSGVG